jgi:chromosome segregation ATPase
MTTTQPGPLDDVGDDLTFRDLTRAIARLSNRLDDQDADLSAAEGRARAWKIEADAARSELDVNLAYVAQLRADLDDAQAKVVDLTDRIADVRKDRKALYDQVVAAGLDPVWKPSTEVQP